MGIELRAAALEEKGILANLLEKYDYEFSQYDKRDVNSNGLYGYEYLDCYWEEEDRWAFFIYVDEMLAGFVMVNCVSEVAGREIDYSMAEFFVMYKYRHSGVGRFAAETVFKRFRGNWQLKLHPNNLISVIFWDKVIDRFTEGNFELVKSYNDSAYFDGTKSDIYLFNTLRNNLKILE